MTKTAAKLTQQEYIWLDALVKKDIFECRKFPEDILPPAFKAFVELRIANMETLREKLRVLGGLK